MLGQKEHLTIFSPFITTPKYFILVGYFGTTNNLPDKYMFDVISDAIKKADYNTSNEETENKLIIDRKVMDSAISTFIHFAAKVKIKHYERAISMLWEQLHIPIRLTGSIIKEVISEIFSEKTKLAERESNHSIAIAIENTLKKHGVIR